MADLLMIACGVSRRTDFSRYIMEPKVFIWNMQPNFFIIQQASPECMNVSNSKKFDFKILKSRHEKKVLFFVIFGC